MLDNKGGIVVRSNINNRTIVNVESRVGPTIGINQVTVGNGQVEERVCYRPKTSVYCAVY